MRKYGEQVSKQVSTVQCLISIDSKHRHCCDTILSALNVITFTTFFIYYSCNYLYSHVSIVTDYAYMLGICPCVVITMGPVAICCNTVHIFCNQNLCSCVCVCVCRVGWTI